MRNRTVMGIFDRPGDAEKVKDELLEAGIARHRIVVSRHDTGNGVAAEVAVVARSPVDRRHIAQLMRRLGARETLESRA